MKLRREMRRTAALIAALPAQGFNAGDYAALVRAIRGQIKGGGGDDDDN